MLGQRLDKWLWCARLVKTRTLAAKLIEAGGVRVNGARTDKASRHVRPGDVVTGTVSHHLFVVRVAAEAKRRGPASEARMLYDDLTPPKPPASSGPAPIAAHRGLRPTKRARRRFERERGEANRSENR